MPILCDFGWVPVLGAQSQGGRSFCNKCDTQGPWTVSVLGYSSKHVMQGTSISVGGLQLMWFVCQMQSLLER